MTGNVEFFAALAAFVGLIVGILWLAKRRDAHRAPVAPSRASKPARILFGVLVVVLGLARARGLYENVIVWPRLRSALEAEPFADPLALDGLTIVIPDDAALLTPELATRLDEIQGERWFAETRADAPLVVLARSADRGIGFATVRTLEHDQGTVDAAWCAALATDIAEGMTVLGTELRAAPEGIWCRMELRDTETPVQRVIASVRAFEGPDAFVSCHADDRDRRQTDVCDALAAGVRSGTPN